MPQGQLYKQALYAKVNKPAGQPQTKWLDYSENLGWNHLEELFPAKCSLCW